MENLREQLSSLISEHGLLNVLTSISNVCDNIAHDLTHDEKEPDEELASEYRAAARTPVDMPAVRAQPHLVVGRPRSGGGYFLQDLVT